MVDNYGQDGHAHLTFFHAGSQLSFVLDMEHRGLVAVSHGGYGEGVIDTFNIALLGGDIERLDVFFGLFEKACVAYVQGWIARYAHEMKQEPEDA